MQKFDININRYDFDQISSNQSKKKIENKPQKYFINAIQNYIKDQIYWGKKLQVTKLQCFLYNFSLLQVMYQGNPEEQFKKERRPSNCEQVPVDQIIRIDDEYSAKSGYFQMHDLCFEYHEADYGNQLKRQQSKITKQIKRYFTKRYFFFSLFDSGIQLDTESWYSVIAEPISLYVIQRLKHYGVKKVFEPFSGVGGLSIQAAGEFQQLVVNDYDKQKIKMLKNNLAVYGKGLNQLTIYNKDYIEIKPFPVDAVIICPPWGGINIIQYSYRDLDQIMVPKLSDILNHCKKFSKNILLQLPKNTNLKNLLKIINLCFLSPIVKIEKIFVQNRLSQLFVYIGDIKFTAFNPQVFNLIIKDSKKEVASLKQAKLNIKRKIKQQNFQIFSEIFQIMQSKPNKHIFFDDN